MPLTTQNLRAYLSRDWAGARVSKDRALGAFVRAKGAAAAFKLGQALLDQVWPRVLALGRLALMASLNCRSQRTPALAWKEPGHTTGRRSMLA